MSCMIADFPGTAALSGGQTNLPYTTYLPWEGQQALRAPYNVVANRTLLSRLLRQPSVHTSPWGP